VRRDRIGEAGRRAERRSSRRAGGRPRPASGAMPGAKGDDERGDFLVEHKATERESMSLRFEVLAKIGGEAVAEGKTPALQIVFCTGSGRPRRGGSWIMVPEHVFEEMRR